MDDAQKRTLRLYQVGETTKEVFNTLPDTGKADDCAHEQRNI